MAYGASGSPTRRAHQEPNSEASRLPASPSWARVCGTEGSSSPRPFPADGLASSRETRVRHRPAQGLRARPLPWPVAGAPPSRHSSEPGGWGTRAGRGAAPARVRGRPVFPHSCPRPTVRGRCDMPGGQARRGCISHAGGRSVGKRPPVGQARGPDGRDRVGARSPTQGRPAPRAPGWEERAAELSRAASLTTTRRPDSSPLEGTADGGGLSTEAISTPGEGGPFPSGPRAARAWCCVSRLLPRGASRGRSNGPLALLSVPRPCPSVGVREVLRDTP